MFRGRPEAPSIASNGFAMQPATERLMRRPPFFCARHWRTSRVAARAGAAVSKARQRM